MLPIVVSNARSAEHPAAVAVDQDVTVYATRLGPSEARALPLGAGRRAWVQVARGDVAVNDTALHQGDGAAVEGETALHLMASSPAEVLVFDLP